MPSLEQFAQTVFNFVAKLRKPDSSLGEAQADTDGNLKVAVQKMVTATFSWVDPANGTPLTYQRVAAAAPKKLHFATGSNEGTAKRWIMFFDALAVPSNGQEPLFAFPVDPGGTFYWAPPQGRQFATGVVWVVSSTAGSLTKDTAASFRVHLGLE